MRIALNIGGYQRDMSAIRVQAQQAAEERLAGVWMSQVFGPDALSTLAVIGQAHAELELGASVVPVYGRHPLVLAMPARTVQAPSTAV